MSIITKKLSEIDTLQVEISRNRPILGVNLEKIKDYWRIGMTYASNALEGNTLTETETKVILEDGITIGGKSIREIQECLGHSNAVKFIYSQLAAENIDYKTLMIELHRLFYTGINEGQAGVFRNENVIITGTDYLPPKWELVPTNVDKEFEKKKKETKHPVVMAAIYHIAVANIHPFVDGNGRTARLLMNFYLLKNGFPVIIIPPILRSDYLTACKLANKGQNDNFILFVAHQVLQSQSDYLRMLA